MVIDGKQHLESGFLNCTGAKSAQRVVKLESYFRTENIALLLILEA